MKSKLKLNFLILLILVIGPGFIEGQENYEPTTVNRATDFEVQKWDTVYNLQLGVDAIDPIGEYIGRAIAKRNCCETWYPMDIYKHVLVGNLQKTYYSDERGDANDLNMVMKPSRGFFNIVGDARAFADEDQIIMCEHGFHDCLEVEFTPDAMFYDFSYFPPYNSEWGRGGRQIGVYGPWVFDKGHGKRPEIHPSEMIWRRETLESGDLVYYLMLFQDDSNRFDRQKDFSGTINHPWSECPRIGKFKIAFQVDLTSLTISNYDIFDLVLWNVLPSADEDSDDEWDHALKYDGRIVIKVREAPVLDVFNVVKFENVRRNNANTRLQGYITIESKIGFTDSDGECDRGTEGFHSLKVVQYNTLPPIDISNYHVMPLRKPNRLIVDWTQSSFHRTRPIGPHSTRKNNLVGDMQITADTIISSRIEKAYLKNGNNLKQLEFIPSRQILKTNEKVIIGKIRGLGIFDKGSIELETDSGKISIKLPEIGLSPVITEAKFLEKKDDTVTWKQYIKSFRNQADIDKFSSNFKRTSPITFEAKPLYLLLKDGKPSPEDSEGETIERLNNAISGSSNQIRKIFGSSKIIKDIKWTFKGKDLITGAQVPVFQKGLNNSQISVEFQGNYHNSQSLKITFPENTSAIYELDAIVEMTDIFGNKSSTKKTFYSGALIGDTQEELLQSSFSIASEMSGVDLSKILAAADLKDTQNEYDESKDDPFLRRSRLFRLYGMYSVEDDVVDINELVSLYKLAQQTKE